MSTNGAQKIRKIHNSKLKISKLPGLYLGPRPPACKICKLIQQNS